MDDTQLRERIIEKSETRFEFIGRRRSRWCLTFSPTKYRAKCSRSRVCGSSSATSRWWLLSVICSIFLINLLSTTHNSKLNQDMWDRRARRERERKHIRWRRDTHRYHIFADWRGEEKKNFWTRTVSITVRLLQNIVIHKRADSHTLSDDRLGGDERARDIVLLENSPSTISHLWHTLSNMAVRVLSSDRSIFFHLSSQLFFFFHPQIQLTCHTWPESSRDATHKLERHQVWILMIAINTQKAPRLLHNATALICCCCGSCRLVGCVQFC